MRKAIRLPTLKILKAQLNDDTLTGDGGANILSGLAGDDLLEGGAGVDDLQGGAGDDSSGGGAGADILSGGADDTDTADYSASGSAVSVDLAAGSGTGGHAQGDTLDTIENVIGSAFGDTLEGDAGVNTLSGGVGDDVAGARRADVLDGGAGSDTASYSGSAAAVSIDLGTSTYTGGDALGDTLTDIENITGSGNDDTIIGDAAANILSGGAGADAITGGAGDDDLRGDAGDDTLIGGAGADVLDGGSELGYCRLFECHDSSDRGA